jgi:hypothetical protein
MALMMEAAGATETSVNHKTTRRSTTEDIIIIIIKAVSHNFLLQVDLL